jgi:hypothetical protein
MQPTTKNDILRDSTEIGVPIHYESGEMIQTQLISRYVSAETTKKESKIAKNAMAHLARVIDKKGFFRLHLPKAVETQKRLFDATGVKTVVLDEYTLAKENRKRSE